MTPVSASQEPRQPGRAPDLHPRPHFTRADWIDLRGTWQFAYDDADLGLDQNWQLDGDRFDLEIQVPFPPESELSGIADKNCHPVIWYRRTAATPDPGVGRILLHFGAVDYRALVWVNGQLVASHEGGHSPFTADITSAVQSSDEMVIVVRSEDDPMSPHQPRGKQDWQPQPHAIWYHRTSGIWQPVWMECVPQVHIQSLHLTPDLPRGNVAVELEFNRPAPEGTECTIELRLKRRSLVRQTVSVQGDMLTVLLQIPGLNHGEARSHLIWSPEHPNLLDVEISLEVAGQAADLCRSYAGMRNCGVAHGKFTLNDKPFFVRAVLEQGYWPQSHLAAPDDQAIRREVELIKALGFNAVRIHQKVEDPRFLYWCDRLGLLVWGEMPSAYAFSARMVARFTREWMDVIARDRSHPCIVTWVPLNESWGIADIAQRADQRAFASATYHLTKSLDPTRPVISNDGWEQVETDVVGVHDYAVLGEQLAARYRSAETAAEAISGFGPQRRRILLQPDGKSRPIMITEFGGISYHPQAGQDWFGYGTVASQEQYLEAVERLFAGLHESRILAGYCYTQLTDTLQEKNGLLDEDRCPKLPINKVRDFVLHPSNAIPAEFLDIARQKAMHSASLDTPGD